MVAFGFSPKISTTVEITVEKRDVDGSSTGNSRFQAVFRVAKPRGSRNFGPSGVTLLSYRRHNGASARRKSNLARFF